MTSYPSQRLLPRVAALIGLASLASLAWSEVLVFRDTGESTGPTFTTAVGLGVLGLALDIIGIVLSLRAIRTRTPGGRRALAGCAAVIPIAVVAYLAVLSLLYS